jgi:cation diffusion facilitator family transporter
MPESPHRRALRLSIFTVAYNLVEGLVSVVAGAAAGSIALVSFGLDSFVESLSGSVMVWRFARHGRISEAEEARIEGRAERLVGITFLALGLYVLYEAVTKLIHHEAPESSPVGIGVAVASLIVMPVLARAKLRVGREVGSRALMADSKETIACSWLSAALLLGLGLNWLAGLWWTDPLAGLVIVAFLLREGYETLWGEDEDEGAAW